MVPIYKKLIETTFMVGVSGAGTLQRQLHHRLRAAILCGELPVGARLPASRAFARQQSVSRNTVLAAYDQLIAEGYLETRRGAGTYVALDLPDSFIKVSQKAHPDINSDISPGTSPKTARSVLQSQAQAQSAIKRPSPTGLPAIDAFPMDVWARLNSSAWRHADRDMLHYSDPLGYEPLREAIASYLTSSRSVHACADQILIVSGLQQGMKLIVDSLMQPQDTIILEDPGYGGLLRCAGACAPILAFTPVDNAGACVPHSRLKNSLLVVSPSHQYPLGVTMPTARRLELIEWARTTDSLILEDDYDSEFRYEGRPLNSLQGISNGEHVIYGGSFSKATFPALRLGYLVLPSHLVKRIVERREATDSFPSIMPQLAMEKFISEGHFARHIRRLRKIHAARQHHYQRCFHAKLGRYFTLTPSAAGLDLVARATTKLKKSGFTKDINWAKAVHSAGLSAMPLSQAYRKEKPTQGLLVGFANFTEQQVATATDKLARIMLLETGF